MTATPLAAHAIDAQNSAPSLRWINRFAALGDRFHTPVQAEPLRDAHWVAWSPQCAAQLGWARSTEWLTVLSGNALAPGMHSVASVYSGHQFGAWAGQLGDGRALWLGELETTHGPQEIQLKGAGRTPYSRMGDGRAVLRSSIREFLCSEAMAGLGIPTTRALCVTGGALAVQRETIEPAAVLTRVAPSFVRFGHFEHFAHTAADTAALKTLADFTIATAYPACAEQAEPYLALLSAVTERTAQLMADWQSVGFCHGVMNTDNMSILGLTIDYGPFGFLDRYDPGHICNHSDTQGRYAFERQPGVAFWNLHALAHALMPLLNNADDAIARLTPFKDQFAQAMMAKMRAKLGLQTVQSDDHALVDELLSLMAREGTDYTITWRRLASLRTADSGAACAASPARDLFLAREAFDAWAARYSARLRAEGSVDAERAQRMQSVNPSIVLRNHLAEVAIRRASEGDFQEIEQLLHALATPFDDHPAHPAYAGFPPDWAQHIEVSCSS